MPSNVYGEFDNVTKVISINRTYVDKIGAFNFDPTKSSIFEFFITSTILHEFIHFGNGLTEKYPNDSYGNDAGFQFEGKYYGGLVRFDYDIITFEKIP